MGAGRRRAALVVRSLLLAALVFAIAGFQLVLPVDRLATVFVVDLSDSVGNAGREDALAFLRETLEEKPDGDVAGIVAFGKDALVERLPNELEEIDRIASAPLKTATDIGAALRLATALFPDDAQKRIVLLSDGNDTTGGGQAEAALAANRGIRDRDPADRARRCRRGPDRTAHDAIDRPSRRVGRGGRGDPLVGRPARDRASLRGWRPGRDPARPARCGRDPRHVRPDAHRGRLPHVPRRRRGRAGIPSARTTGRTRTRSSRASPGPWSSQATRMSPRSSSPRSRGSASRSIRIVPEALPTDFAGLATYDSIVLVDVPRLRLTDRQLAALQVYVRDLGKGLVMVGGPSSYGAGGYQQTRSRRRCRSTWACATGRSSQTSRSWSSSTSRVRWPPATATPSTRARGGAGIARRAEGGHRQGSDPAGGGGHDRARRARGGGVQRGRALGRTHAAARRDRRPPGTDRGDQGRRADQHLRRARPGRAVARRGRRRRGDTSSC